MTDDEIPRPGPTRRTLLSAAGIGGLAIAAGGRDAATAAPASTPRAGTDPVRVPPVAGLHLQFGADASREVVVSWHTLQPVTGARVVLDALDGSHPRTVRAETRSYVDGKSGRTVHTHHARLDRLRGDHDHSYRALHDGAQAEAGSFRTAPRGRARFTFTSFGDQGTPTTGKAFVPPAGVTLPRPVFVNDNLGAPNGADVTTGVERVAPLFHLFNGDLCYANLATDRIRTWSDFWDNTSRSARHRPWMPSAGNHENEAGNGPLGFAAYQSWFSLPAADGQTDTTRGLWYAFTVGSVRVISLANDDVCYQDAGDSYVRGYSAGAQRAWLERELAGARKRGDVDWVVVCMHQVAISTADGNGADLGVREEWLPLFDRYGVDLVVCGHEHHYERSHPIRGHEANATRTPLTDATRTDVVDTTAGTVHMVIGGGGSSVTSNQLLFTPRSCKVITGVGEVNPTTHKRPPVYVTEPAAWSAVRNADHPYGFAAFTVDPGTRRTGTTITVTYYDVVGVEGELQPFETFTLHRPRSDA